MRGGHGAHLVCAARVVDCALTKALRNDRHSSVAERGFSNFSKLSGMPRRGGGSATKAPSMARTTRATNWSPKSLHDEGVWLLHVS